MGATLFQMMNDRNAVGVCHLMVSCIVVLSFLGVGVVPAQSQPDTAFYYGTAVAEDGTDIPAGTTIKAIAEEDGSNRTVDEIMMETAGEYGGSGLGEEKLEVPGSVDGPVYFVAKNDLGEFTAEETVQNPSGGTQQLDLTFPPGSAESRPFFTVSNLRPADVTVVEGETVAVNATIENSGSEQGIQTVALNIGGSTLGTRDVTLGPGSRESVGFSVDTATIGAGNYTHEVSTDDDSQTGYLTVEPREATFEVSRLDPADTSVIKGEAINSSATVANEGNAEGTQTVSLQAGGTTLANEDVTLAAGEERAVTFSKVGTDPLAPGTYTYGIHTDNQSQTGTLTVEARQAAFAVSGLELDEETVTVGSSVAVSANVSNDGNAEGSQTVTLQINGEQFGSEDTTLVPGDRQAVSFAAVNTTQLGPGSYTYEVASENDSQSGTLVVESDSPAEFRVIDLTPVDQTVTADSTYDTEATLRNDGDQEATQAVQYQVDGDTVDRQAVTLASGGRTTVGFTDLGTASLGAGTYTHGVYTNNDSQTGNLTVERNEGNKQGPAATFTVTAMAPRKMTVTRGTGMEVTATIRNDGGAEGTQSVQFRRDSEAVDSESVSLGQSETATVTFTAGTDTLAAETYTYGVYSNDDEQVGTLTVEDERDTPTPDGSGTPRQSDGTTTPPETQSSSTQTTGTGGSATATDDSTDDDGGLIPGGLLRTLLIYVGVPMAIIYGLLKAMAIYLGY